MNNRILAMLLAIIMIVSIVPVNAFATEELVHAEGCSYSAAVDCVCSGITWAHSMNTGWGECTYREAVACDMDCANNADPAPAPTPEVPAEHTHKDENGAVGGGPNGVCDISGCTEHVHKAQAVEAVTPTCTTGGNLAYVKCAFCTKILDENGNEKTNPETDYILNPDTVNGHKLTKVEAKEPTCVEKGNWTYYKCGTCNKLYNDEAATQEVTEAYVTRDLKTTHTLGDYIQDGQNGHYRACTVDGCEYTTDLIPHNTFRYENGKKICVNCEYAFDHICEDEDKNCKCDVAKCGAELTHNIVWNSNDKGKHYQSCGNANCFKKTLTGWEDCVDTDNDCICNTCGGKMVHTLTAVEAKAATCAVDGNIAHQKCTNCNGTFDADGKPVDPVTTLDHWEIWALDEENGTHYKVCKRSACQEVLSEPEAHNATFTTQYDTVHQGVCSICNLVVTEDHYDSTDDEDCSCDDCGKFLGHTLTPVAKVDAKCGVNGNVEHQLCENCGKTLTPDGTAFLDDVVIKARKHWEIWEYDAEADTHTKICKYSTCREVLIEEEPHEFTYTVRQDGRHNAVCSECGFTQARDHVDEDKNCVCDKCGYEKEHIRDDLTYHGYVSATCTTDGHHGYYTCNTCTGTFQKSGEAFLPYTDYVMPALGHDWGTARQLGGSVYHSWHCQRTGCVGAKIELHADENDDCKCDVCGAFAHGTIKYMEAKAATCTEDGHQGYYYYDGCSKKFADEAGTSVLTALEVYQATGHDEHGEWTACEDGKNHELHCLDCGVLLYTEAHDFSGEAPYCVDCGSAEGLVYYAEEPATCYENGTKAHYKSSITGRSYWDVSGTQYINDLSDLRITKLEHDLVVMPGEGVEHPIVCQNGCGYEDEGTCKSEDGNCFCDECGVPMAGHTYEQTDFIAPTCTKPGQMAVLYCAECDQYYDIGTHDAVLSAVLEPMGHRWESNWYNDTREGTHSRDCLRYGCGEKLSAAHTLEIEDTLKGNLHQGSCTICDYIETGIHSDKDGDTLCDECGHDSATVVTGSDLDNPRETVKVTVKTDGKTWLGSFIDRLNPSYVGEAESNSAPSASVGTSVPGSGSGSGSGSSSGGSSISGTGSSSSSTGTSAIDAVVQFLLSLLNSLLGI